MEKLRIVVTGFIGLYPTGGVTWDYIQYPLGLKMLGHDVYYLEDTAQFPKYQKGGRGWNDATDSIEYLERVMRQFGLENRWCYVDTSSGNYFGLTKEQIISVCESADLFINVSASCVMRDEYYSIPVRAFIDTDPMFTQIQYELNFHEYKGLNKFKMDYLLNQHNCFLSFGEGIHSASSKIPNKSFAWQTTRQPICSSYWQNSKRNHVPPVFSTVMNWSVTKPLYYAGASWGQKNVELMKLSKLPSQFKEIHFNIIASRVPKEDLEILQNFGWHVHEPFGRIDSPTQYMEFLQSSYGEFSVAKETYVKSNSGWFSCRSACYLAAGKPVVTQETGWSSFIPSGRGVLAFTDLDSAVGALESVHNNYEEHCKWASIIAKEYFDSDKVLKDMLSKISGIF